MASPSRVVFRVDASLDIGTGHVMRCLTLADALRRRGAECSFICRDLPGHLAETIRARQYAVALLPHLCEEQEPLNAGGPPYGSWLGVSWSQDAAQTRLALAGMVADWLVADHYALDARWESGMRPVCRHLMVIDDLADRPHACDLLLDQNLGRTPGQYGALVPHGCRVLIGPEYALLRPDFAKYRRDSLMRRQEPALSQLLISLGGVDKFNVAGQVLDALSRLPLPTCHLKVVLGPHSPWVEQVRQQASAMDRVEVLVNVDDMAALMAESDLAIGAAGTTAWERCCLGLPTITLVL
ncbi:MAG TPA: UDP-2,4-diacetamido-2,4,6-trideoxy-beta-L-altropyranose hydrolase, partial [Azospira sp.]|nr:UDP-2,4-diacetamido-2,4,6-trideoxy-beta-L-altropyranose hydrolase [Azospira sp.]